MKKMKGIFICMVLSMLVACGGGSSGTAPSPTTPSSPPPPPPPPHTLTGTWFGTIEDLFSELHTLSITFNNDGNVTSISLDGVTQTNTVNVIQIADSIYEMSFDGSSKAIIIVSSTATHLAILDDVFSFGVVQKNASNTLPTFTPDELVGDWSGFRVTLDANFNIVDTFNTSATFDTMGNGTINVNENIFTATLIDYNADFGVFYYDSLGPDQTALFMEFFLSPDKTFGASWACWTFESFPENCFFGIWE